MIETLLVLGTVVAIAVLGWLAPLVPLPVWLWAGGACAAAGLLFGVPTGFWYHVRLHACLAPRRRLPPRWWLHPVSLHVHLTPAERAGVQRWFMAGGVGFGLTLLGTAIAGVGAVLEMLRLTR